MDFLNQFLNLQELLTDLVAFLPKLFVAVLFYLGFVVLYRLTRRPLDAILRRSGIEPVLISLLVDKVYRFSLTIFGLVMAASQVGINVGAALAGIGVVGVALGFAAQDLLSNIIAGFVIFWDEPFHVGEFITVQDEYGRVTNITLRSTRIQTNRNTFVVIPNRRIIDHVVLNHSAQGDTRIDVPVGIAYKENIPQARAVLLKAVADVKDVLSEPPPTVVVDSLGDSSVNLLVRVWIRDARAEQPVHFAVTEMSKLALDAAGIQIPFPHLQLFVDDVEDRVLDKIATVPGRMGGASG
jgi:small conductance mechanosensitive channel